MKYSKIPLRYTVTALILCCNALPAFASRTGSDVVFNFSAYHEQDSSVGIVELEDYTREGDASLLVKTGVKGAWQTSQGIFLNSHYDFTHRKYTNLHDYDSSRHHFSLAPSVKIAGVKLSLRHDWVSVDLAGDKFMAFKQNTLSLERPLGGMFYLRVAMNNSNKILKDYQDRNAKARVFSGDIFWFDTTGTHTLSLSASAGQENAFKEDYDFSSNKINVNYTRSIKLLSMPGKFRFGMGRLSRHYAPAYDTLQKEEASGNSLTNPGIGDLNDEQTRPGQYARKDNNFNWVFALESSINTHVDVSLSFTVVDNKSNMEEVSYKENVSAIGLKARF